MPSITSPRPANVRRCAQPSTAALSIPHAGHRSPGQTPIAGHVPNRSTHLRRDGGYSVLEAVIVLPAMILFAMLVIQYALLWHGRHVAQAAAQSGLRVARGFEAAPQAGDTAARNYLADVAPNLLQAPTVRTTQTATTTTVTVQAKVLSLMSFGDFSVTQVASGPRELFVTP
jgi:hypothetical protein